jgi:uncharacterized membrane protein
MKSLDGGELDTMIGKSLRVGVFLSALVMLIGLVLFLVTGNSGYPGDTYPTDPLAVFQGAIALKPYAIMLAGLLLLILTPVFRVGVSVIVFIKEKDYAFVRITSLVLAILIISLLLGNIE